VTGAVDTFTGGMLAEVPVEVSRQEASRRAAEELSRQAYAEARPGFLERAVQKLAEWIADLVDGARALSPSGWLAALVLLLLLAGVAVVVRRRIGPLARASGDVQPLFVGGQRSAAEHRRAADAHASDGRWDDAVRERLRAIVTDMEERGLLDARAGRTALEAAHDGGRVLPSCAAELHAGAELFDDVWYGGRAATERSDAALRALDERVRAGRPEPMAASGAPRQRASPR
jgi:hypothetical protein